jgi:guanidinoacetate N-methyltransferase
MPSSFAFDSSVAGIFWTLSDGGTLHIPEEAHAQDVHYLAQLIGDSGITHLLCVPSLYQILIELSKQPLSSLRAVIVAGEPCLPSLVTAHRKAMGSTRLYNEYGPSECTVWCTAFDCTEAIPGENVSIGRPIPGSAVYVLDAQNRLLPQGVPGELCVAGPGVSPGYLNLDEITRQKFLSIPLESSGNVRVYKTGDRGRYREDGNIEFLGRTDDQLKIRGFRIEPAEIEAILARHEAVKEVVVSAASSHHPAHGDSGSQSNPSTSSLNEQLETLGASLAEALLREAELSGTVAPQESTVPAPANGKSLIRTLSTDDFKTSIQLINTDFMRPPLESQREWLLDQLMREMRDDLIHLNKVSSRFVAGSPRGLEEFDITEVALSDDDIMEDWQVPIMRSMAAGVGETHGDILEIGFGRGVAASFIQEHEIRSHTVIEANAHSVNTHFSEFKKRYPDRDIQVHHGMWQDKIDPLGTFDGILFHAFPLNEEDFIENIVNSVTFAAHFFPHAAAHLKPGGVFTYLSTEIDSLGRGHQRALFQHFTSVTTSTLAVQVPQDTRDSWWADSMVIVKAVK